MSDILDEHREYLSDKPRLAAYERALAEMVRPGDVVLDLGSGTAILALFACRACASRVYAVDGGGMADVARTIVAANGFSDRISVVDGFTDAIELPERADLLVTYQLGQLGFEAGIVGAVADARRRLLKPDARVMPSRLDLCLAAVDVPDVNDAIDFWSDSAAGFDVSSVRVAAVNSCYAATLNAANLLGPPTRAGAIDLMQRSATVALRADLQIDRVGNLRGIAGWFVAHLSPHVTISNAPLDPSRVRRPTAVLPLDPSIDVVIGDRLCATVRALPNEMIMSWTGEVRRMGRAAAAFTHSTLAGMLLTPEHVKGTDPSAAPMLGPRGRARLAVLTLCDGTRSMTDIEREVFARYPAIFADRAAAAAFVARVVAANTR